MELSQEIKAELVEKVKGYMLDELDVEIGGFDAEFLIEFIAKEIGPKYYNQGLEDAKAVIHTKLDDIDDAFYNLEQ